MDLAIFGGGRVPTLENTPGWYFEPGVVHQAYITACATESKDCVGLEEFGKRIKKCFETKNCRSIEDPTMCVRIISYVLK
jgi:hypothetical protein